jgi:hypothetical protein
MTERAARTVLYVFGLLFVAGIFPLLKVRGDAGLQMILSGFVALGVFLLNAVEAQSAQTQASRPERRELAPHSAASRPSPNPRELPETWWTKNGRPKWAAVGGSPLGRVRTSG